MDHIDSEDFDPKITFDDLLKSHNLKNLVQTNLEIQADIKSLDHDVQSLVFENYSKFISSIEVVKNMREELEKTEQDLDKLTNSISNIKNTSTYIDDTLKPKRDEIQRLDKINKDLSNLKMLCELPLMLKEDLKQLHSLDLRNMSKENMLKHKDDLLKICIVSLENLNSCKDKLIEFHKEPLIAPIFVDVSKYLKEIQNYLYLHFHDNYSKLTFEMLGDLFFKLFNITTLIEVISKIDTNISSSITIDNIIGIFFKNLHSNFLYMINYINSTHNKSSVDSLSALLEINLENQKEYEHFKSKLVNVFEKINNKEAYEELNSLTNSVFIMLLDIDKRSNRYISIVKALESYQKQKSDFLTKFTVDLYNKVTCINFYFKLQVIISNKTNLPKTSSDDVHPFELLTDNIVLEDIFEYLELLRSIMDNNLKSKELIDLKTTKFSIIRNEANVKHEIVELADNFTTLISNYAKFIKEILETYLPEHRHPELQLDNLLFKFLLKLICSYNNHTYFKPRQIRKQLIGPALQKNNQNKKLNGLKILNYVFISRLTIIFENSYSKTQKHELKHILLSNIIAYLQKSWTKLFIQMAKNNKDSKPQTEILNSIKNLIFLANNIELQGNPKSRISKNKIIEMFPKVSETSKLLARQNYLVDDVTQINRQKIYFAFIKAFYKTLKIYIKHHFKRNHDLSPVFSILVQISQIFFECAEKEDESTIAAYLYQSIDELEIIGCKIDIERMNFLLQTVKEQIF